MLSNPKGFQDAMKSITIQDEFTNLPIPSRKKYRLRHLRDGKCMACQEPLYTSSLCKRHALEHSKKQRRYQLRDEKKHRARELVARALRKGKLFREECEVCGNPNAEAHHEDYDAPLDVTWLCQKHHSIREGKKYTPLPKLCKDGYIKQVITALNRIASALEVLAKDAR